MSTFEKVNEVVTFLGKNVKENPKFDDNYDALATIMWYTDEKEFNVWRHYETGELPLDPIMWNIGEPNGAMVENCAILLVKPSTQDESKYNAFGIDVTCGHDFPLVCENIGELSLKLRGICKNSLIDTSYAMIEGATNKKRYFAGNTGWKIYWDNSGELWRLSNQQR